MSMAKLFNVAGLIMVIKIFIFVSASTINEKLKKNITGKNLLDFKNHLIGNLSDDKNKIIPESWTEKNSENFLFDFDNILKTQDAKIHLNKKLKQINAKSDLEVFIFLFADLDESLTLKQPWEEAKLTKSFDTKIVRYKENPFFSNSKFNKTWNINFMKRKINKRVRMRNTSNLEYEYKINLKRNSSSELIFEKSIPDNDTINDKEMNARNIKNNKNNNISDFLYCNSLEGLENSMIIFISQRRSSIMMFLGEKVFHKFSYEDERKIAENFIEISKEKTLDLALNYLLESLEILLISEKQIILIEFIIICGVLFIVIEQFIFKTMPSQKPKKNTRKGMLEYITIIKQITKNNIDRKNPKEYSNNDCIICLEEFSGLGNNTSKLDDFKQNRLNTVNAENLFHNHHLNIQNLTISNHSTIYKNPKKQQYRDLNMVNENDLNIASLSCDLSNNLKEDIKYNKHSRYSSSMDNRYETNHLNIISLPTCSLIGKDENIEKINSFSEESSQDNSHFRKKFDKINNEIFPAILNCGHMFHSYCIALWLTKGNFCPICRSSISKDLESEKTTNINTSSFPYYYYYNNLIDMNDSISLSYNMENNESN